MNILLLNWRAWGVLIRVYKRKKRKWSMKLRVIKMTVLVPCTERRWVGVRSIGDLGNSTEKSSRYNVKCI